MPEDKSEDIIEQINETIGINDELHDKEGHAPPEKVPDHFQPFDPNDPDFHPPPLDPNNPNVPMPGPMPPKPFDPNDLTNAEKIKVMESMFKYHPGQHVRNLLNENGYVHTIGITIDGRKLYGVIHPNQNFQYYTCEEIKTIGFDHSHGMNKPLKTDIDDDTIKRSFLKQQQDILKEQLKETKQRFPK